MGYGCVLLGSFQRFVPLPSKNRDHRRGNGGQISNIISMSDPKSQAAYGMLFMTLDKAHVQDDYQSVNPHNRQVLEGAEKNESPTAV